MRNISPLTEFQYTQTQSQDTISPNVMLAYTCLHQHSVLMLILHARGATPHSLFFVGGDKQADDG